MDLSIPQKFWMVYWCFKRCWRKRCNSGIIIYTKKYYNVWLFVQIKRNISLINALFLWNMFSGHRKVLIFLDLEEQSSNCLFLGFGDSYFHNTVLSQIWSTDHYVGKLKYLLLCYTYFFFLFQELFKN